MPSGSLNGSLGPLCARQRADLRSASPPGRLSKGAKMTDAVDELGPVDYLVVEFPPGQQNFSGEMASELARLHDSGIIRVLDILLVTKSDAGDIEALEI